MKVPLLRVHILTEKSLASKLAAAKAEEQKRSNKRIVKLTGQVVRLEMILKSLFGNREKKQVDG